MVLKSLLTVLILIKEESGGPPSARRFVTLRASENNVMRKLEIYSLLAPDGLCLCGYLCLSITAVGGTPSGTTYGFCDENWKTGGIGVNYIDVFDS